jgi:hypothetical protein
MQTASSIQRPPSRLRASKCRPSTLCIRNAHAKILTPLRMSTPPLSPDGTTKGELPRIRRRTSKPFAAERRCPSAKRTQQAHQERSMKFRPLHDRVVVKRVDAESKTASGIIIPDNAKEKPSEGEVVAVGPTRRGRQAHPDRRAGRRPRALRQMVGYRGQDRRRRVRDHEGERRHGGAD